jgi:hypothetical protein
MHAPAPDWRSGTAARRQLLLIALFSGLWAVVSGLAVFVLFTPGGDPATAVARRWAVGVSLVIAVASAAVIEWLRDRIEQRSDAAHRHGLGITITVLTLIIFELCSGAVEHLSQRGVEDASGLGAFARRVMESTVLDRRYPLYQPGDFDQLDRLWATWWMATKAPESEPARRILSLFDAADRERVLVCFESSDSVRLAPLGQETGPGVLALEVADCGRVLSPVSGPGRWELENTEELLLGLARRLDAASKRLGGSAGAPEPRRLAAESPLWRPLGISQREYAERIAVALNGLLFRRDLYDRAWFPDLDSDLARRLEEARDTTGPGAPSLPEVAELNAELLGATLGPAVPAFTARRWNAWRDLTAVGLVWLAASVTLVIGLIRLVLTEQPATLRGVARSALGGLRAGLWAAPIGLLGYGILMRGGFLVRELALEPERGMRWVASLITDGWVGLRFGMVPIALGQLAAVGDPVGLVATGAVALAAIVAIALRKRRRALEIAGVWFGIPIFLLLAQPLCSVETAALLLAAVISWAIPGLLLGAAVPIVRPAAKAPPVWPLVGWAVGAALAGLAWFWRDGAVLAIALLAIGAALLVRRNEPVRELWPGIAILTAAALGLGARASVSLGASQLFTEVRGLRIRAETGVAAGYPEAGRPIQEGWVAGPPWRGSWLSADSADRVRRSAYEAATARRLNVSLFTALGFWAMIGLLAAWSVQHDRLRPVATSPERG